MISKIKIIFHSEVFSTYIYAVFKIEPIYQSRVMVEPAHALCSHLIDTYFFLFPFYVSDSMHLKEG